MGLAYVMRGNLLVAVLGTIVGNPWTFPVIWAVAYELGALLIGVDTSTGFLSDAQINALMELPFLDAVTQGFGLLEPYLASMLVGGFILGTLSWFVFYWPLRRMIEVLQARRRSRIARGAARRADGVREEG